MAKVFVVDDDELILRSLSRILEQRGLEVRAFLDPLEALEQLDLAPDLLLCDYHLPHLDGLELAAQLKSRFPRARVLLFSGDLEDERIVRSCDAGTVDRFVAKPWRIAELLETIEALLG